MKALHRESEKYRASGNLAAEGMQNQLGRPGLDRLTVLVRETVQNSWDARLPDDEPVLYALDLHHLTAKQARFLNEVVFATRPARDPIEKYLAEKEKPALLVISDRGTWGLGGPTLADVVPAEGERSDFVNLVRNVGLPSKRSLSGGTYGYGKAVLYRSSEVAAVCIYSRCKTGRKLQSRFIAAALGKDFAVRKGAETGRYTGRHWWGRPGANGVAEPLLDDEADEAAASIGIRGFGRGESGTSIAIVGPVLGDRTPQQALAHMHEALLWYFWPKMISQRGRALPMRFELALEGESLPVFGPDQFPPLEHYVACLRDLKLLRQGKELGPDVAWYEIACERPKEKLGFLVLRKGLRRRRRVLPADGDDDGGPIAAASSHVALMRNAELVVKYLPGPTLPLETVEYGGVFIPHEAIDREFAESEPPTHDDWSPDELEATRSKTLVRVALRRIKERMKEFAQPSPAEALGVSSQPLGGFAGFMGLLLPGLDGTGAGVQGQPGGPRRGSTTSPGSRGPRPTVRLQEDRTYQVIGGQPAVLFPVDVRHAKGTKGTMVTARPKVGVLHGQAVESEPPIGAESPIVLGWLSPSGKFRRGAEQVEIDGAEEGTWRIAVKIIPDAALAMSVSAESMR